MAASLRPSMALARTPSRARAVVTHATALAMCPAHLPKLTERVAAFSAPSPSPTCSDQALFWSRRRACMATAASAQTTSTDAATFLRDVAAVEPPPALSALLRVLQIQGFEAVDPSDRKSIVPLLVPVAKDSSSDGKAQNTTRNVRQKDSAASVANIARRVSGVRKPSGDSYQTVEYSEGHLLELLRLMELPVVSIEEDGTLQLKARSCLEYVNRCLAEEDAAGPADGTPMASAVGEGAEVCEGLYRGGDFASSGIPRIEVFLLKKVGPFPDIMEQLALGHLARGDEVSALVTGEYYASPKHFPGFGRPYIFNSELLMKVGRKTEASDSARIALRSPWWTLGVPYQVAADLAGYGTTLLEYSQERISDEGRDADIQKGKSPGQVALDQSAFLLDVATVDGSWDAVRERLAALYEEGGLPDMAKFVMVA